MKKVSKPTAHIARFVGGGAGLALAALALYATGIGCPIKWLTGISCPGCGMTRAWLCVLRLDLYHALAYHPLFWMLPLALVLVALRGHVPRRAIDVAMALCVVAVLVVWVIRLATPPGADVLFSDRLREDVVCVEAPAWIRLAHSLLGARLGAR